ncbi:hypothetical protein [Haloferax elongans]|nr:hypothetical protein [Haloferax elongans]
MSNPDAPEPLYETAAGVHVGTTANGQPVVAEEGDGSLSGADCQRDRNAMETTVVPFTQASTTFHARDADNEERWNNLWEHQHEWKRDDIGRRTHMDKVRLTQALGDNLGLSRNQRGRAVSIAATLNGRRFNRFGGINALALGAIAYIGDQDAETFEDRIIGRDRFDEICDQLGADGVEGCRKIKEIFRGSPNSSESTA